MKIPISWLQDFVEIELSIEELAQRLTLAGLEVEEIRYVGLPTPERKLEGRGGEPVDPETKVAGLSWDPDKIVVGAILEVMPHPNADRLVLCRLDDGHEEHTVLTGAPNLFPYKGKGSLEKPLKVAYAREGAQLYDGHKPGWQRMTLKRAKIRGIESKSMACSEKELGISEDHEGVIILDDDAPVGMPLVDYMGDAVLEIVITPNIARNANVLGVAREVSALTGASLKEPDYDVPWKGSSIEGRVGLEIKEPERNPRFVLGLIEGIRVGPSPYWVQRRLRLAGMRPINNVVDATNYVMLAVGEPLHAFDYDVLTERAGGKQPKIITRSAAAGERLITLDEEKRTFEDFTVLVTDTAGPLSIAGVMGGMESEVSTGTRNVLLEGAAWNFINIRRTLASQRVSSEAAYRFSRGVHPAMAERGVRLGLKMMQQLAGGTIAQGLIDAYPLPPKDPTVEISSRDAERWLGIRIEAEEMAAILARLQFKVEVEGEIVRAAVPDHRLDIGEGVVGKADLMEEIARIYGYDRIPETQISDRIPPQYRTPRLEQEEALRDLLVGLGLQEVITYRLTSPTREMRLLPPDLHLQEGTYVHLDNPISSERVVMRKRLLASVMEIVESNARLYDRIAVFEIGPIFLPQKEDDLPAERKQLAIVLTGPRVLETWQGSSQEMMDFYDMKGMVEKLLSGLKLGKGRFVPGEHPSFHPGKCARLQLGEKEVGILGEIHPLVQAQYEHAEAPIIAAEFDLSQLLEGIPDRFTIGVVSAFPPVLEDLALVVNEEVSAQRVQEVIQEAGGDILVEVHLFDLYRGEQIGEGKKSLAYALTYQAPDRTLTDQEVAKVRENILREVEAKLAAKLRE